MANTPTTNPGTPPGSQNSQSTGPRNYAAPGAINITKLELHSGDVAEVVDLRRIVVTFNIFESLSHPFITAEFLIKDAQSLITTYPITGNETLYISFQTPVQGYDRLIDIKLRVVLLRRIIVETRVRHALYLLRAVSREMFNDMNHTIRWSYPKMLVSDMVEKIYTTNLQVDANTKIQTTASEGLRSIIIPNMSPTQAIHFLCREAKNTTFPASDYIFYSDLSNKYYFKTMDEMIKITPIDVYYFTEKDVILSSKAYSPSDRSTKPIEFMRIDNVSIESAFDIEKLIRTGGFANIVMFINPVVSYFEQKTFVYPINHLNVAQRTLGTPDRRGHNVGNFVTKDSDLANMSGDGHYRYMYTDYGETGDEAQTADQKPNFFPLRVGSIALMDNLVINISVPGDSDRRVGDTVQINMPEFGATDDVLKDLHHFYSGRWLVLAVRHIYDAEHGYHCQIQLMKNAYEPRDPDMVVAKKPKLGTNAVTTLSNPLGFLKI